MALMHTPLPATTVIFIDTERNGCGGNRSVLSVSALKAEYDGVLFRTSALYERFYYAKERLRSDAVKLHGLSRDRIGELRGEANYPVHYRDDREALRTFLGERPKVVGHNLASDLVPLGLTLPRRERFCTQQSCLDLVGALACSKGWCPHRGADGGLGKACAGCTRFLAPGLVDTALHFGVLGSDEMRQLHSSSFDAELCRRIFNAMLHSDNPAARRRCCDFLAG